MRIIRHFLDKYNNNVVLVARTWVEQVDDLPYIKENKLQTIRIEATVRPFVCPIILEVSRSGRWSGRRKRIARA